MKNARYVLVAAVILLLVISIRISQPVAAQTDNTCHDGSQPDPNGDCSCPDGGQPDPNGDCPNIEDTS
jgi:hypothetical protein